MPVLIGMQADFIKQQQVGLKYQVQHYRKTRSDCMEKKYEHLSIEERALIQAKLSTNGFGI